MAKKKTQLYPCIAEADKLAREAIAAKRIELDEQPDFIGGKPNYNKFNSWPPEKVLVWLNID